MDIERTIDDIEQLEETFEAPDIRPLSASDLSAANRRHNQMLANRLALRLKPIVQLVTVYPSALLVKFVGALLNLLLNRDQDGWLVGLRYKC